MSLDRKARVRWQSALCASLKGLNFIIRKLHEEKENHGRHVRHKVGYSVIYFSQVSLGALWRLDLKGEDCRPAEITRWRVVEKSK